MPYLGELIFCESFCKFQRLFAITQSDTFPWHPGETKDLAEFSIEYPGNTLTASSLVDDEISRYSGIQSWAAWSLDDPSARNSTFGGMVTPICLATFRLMMNSNFVDCSTDRSGPLSLDSRHDNDPDGISPSAWVLLS